MLKTFDYDKIPVVEIVNDIFVDAAKKGASDIHFDPHDDYLKVRIRIDGVLIDYTEVPDFIRKNLVTRIKIISGMNITESRLPQDGAIKSTISGVDLDLRVSCLPTLIGEKIVVRILDYQMSQQGLESLGFSQDNYEKVVKMISLPNGIILVTGATGSGKSTTVYSILQRLNKEETNIITVEDPIEMNIDGINQVQTNSEIGLTFASALRSILRQDPNIIMIGEIRDTETAKIAVRASITGHLVLSTIHTNNSLNTIERLLDMDVERYLLSSALSGIISQKLARKLCPNCRKTRKTNDYEKDLFKKVLNKDVDEIYVNEGCEECGNGYKGRIAIHEVLLVNQDIKDAISSNMRKEDLRHLVYKSNVATLLQDGLEKVIEGLTTFEEILKVIELDDDSTVGKYDLRDSLENIDLSKNESNSNKQNKNKKNNDEKNKLDKNIEENNEIEENIDNESNNEIEENIENEITSNNENIEENIEKETDESIFSKEENDISLNTEENETEINNDDIFASINKDDKYNDKDNDIFADDNKIDMDDLLNIEF